MSDFMIVYTLIKNLGGRPNEELFSAAADFFSFKGAC